MKQNYKNSVIIVESDLEKLANTIYFTKLNMTMEQTRGAVASLYAKYEVPVLFASTRNNFVELVNKISEKSGEDKNLQVFEPPVKKTGANPKLQILLQVPHIGFKKAKKILDYYGTFSNFDKMERPVGISEKDIQNILEVLK